MVFGPKRLPELAKTMGKGIAHLKTALKDVKEEVDKEVNAVENPVKHLPTWKDAEVYKSETPKFDSEAKNQGAGEIFQPAHPLTDEDKKPADANAASDSQNHAAKDDAETKDQGGTG